MSIDEVAARMRVGERIAAPYRGSAGLAGIAVTGSVSRRQADRYSDLEVLVLWSTSPSVRLRAHAARAAGAAVHRLGPYDRAAHAWWDELFIGWAIDQAPSAGLLVEVTHTHVETVEDVLSRIHSGFAVLDSQRALVAAIDRAVPLGGGDLVPRLQELTSAYPESLATNIVERVGQIDHFWRWSAHLRRRNVAAIYGAWNDISEQLMEMIYAANRVHFPGPKFPMAIDELRHRPANLAARLEAAFEPPVADAAPRLAELIEETYDIVESRVADVDVERLRRIFRFRRAEWPRAVDDGAPADPAVPP